MLGFGAALFDHSEEGSAALPVIPSSLIMCSAVACCITSWAAFWFSSVVLA